LVEGPQAGMKRSDDMRAQYTRKDFVKLERGKFVSEVAKGTSVVMLDSLLAGSPTTLESPKDALDGAAARVLTK
jgi:hypothetical protein